MFLLQANGPNCSRERRNTFLISLQFLSWFFLVASSFHFPLIPIPSLKLLLNGAPVRNVHEHPKSQSMTLWMSQNQQGTLSALAHLHWDCWHGSIVKSTLSYSSFRQKVFWCWQGEESSSPWSPSRPFAGSRIGAEGTSLEHTIAVWHRAARGMMTGKAFYPGAAV